MLNDSVLISKYTLFRFANRAVVSPINSSKKYSVEGFLAVDRINDIIILKLKDYRSKGIPVYKEAPKSGGKIILVGKPRNKMIPLQKGKMLGKLRFTGRQFYKISNRIVGTRSGSPVFYDGKVIGLGFSETVEFEQTNLVTPMPFILKLYEQRHEVKALSALTGDEATSRANAKIKGLKIVTEVGTIQIRLFNETPAYRDNFIRLVEENYYDSLLIHRIIKGFGIQSGAADTRYAKKDDIVGWKGPGYTIPAHFNKKRFHRRGMIGSPRMPDTKNEKRRSDGSQYYIVSGRKYMDDELDEIEKQNNYKFSPLQRKVYKTEGGAPHLDGSYTIFGEVTSGMKIVDALSLQPVDSDYRPLVDIRVLDIEILK
jgi:cyclophilin family peptidyl-prolyl cis-trans isomerase